MQWSSRSLLNVKPVFVCQVRHQNENVKQKYFFGIFHSADFWQKTLKVNKIAMKKFLKKSVVRGPWETLGPATHV